MSPRRETARSAEPTPPPRRFRRAVAGLIFLVLVPPSCSAGQVLLARWVDPPTTITMLTEASRDPREVGWRHPDHWPVSLAAAGRTARAFVASEDAAFFLHDGFDWRSICAARKAHEQDARKRLRGGSSITQQVARNVFLIQRRSWIRKGLEAWYTVLLEAFLPKDRILELYLSVAQTGPMTFGVEAGAQRWFGVPAASLTSDQAARLAWLLPDPRRRRPTTESATTEARVIQRRGAPFPGDPGFEAARRAHRAAAPHPLTCAPR